MALAGPAISSSAPDIPYSAAIDAVLTAGGRISGEFARAAGTDIKALIRVGDETILRRTIETLRATGRCGRIVVVGPEAALEDARQAGIEGTVIESRTGPENFLAGLQWLQRNAAIATPRALLMPTDIPFLTPEGIVRFLDASPAAAELALSIVSRADYESRFPGSSNVFVRLQDGEFTLGGPILIRPDAYVRNRLHIDRVFQARKSQLAMARLLGPLFIVRFLTRTLRVAHVERRCADILQCTGAAVLDCAPELAFDIDLPEEYDYVRKHASG